MQISELQLRQNIQRLLKEEVYGKIATVYHGSKQSPKEFIKLFENESGLVGWETGKGAGSMYGHGLYTVWTKTDHQTFKGGYGNWIYKFKVNLEGFIIFDDAICKKVYGASLTPLQQLEKLGKKQLINSFDENAKRELSVPPVENAKSSNFAARTNKYLVGNVNGIVFWGSNDGPVVIVYDPNIVTPMSYAKRADAKKDIWTRWIPAKIKKSLSRSAQAGTFADPERLQSSKLIITDLNKLAKISDENIEKILEKDATDDDVNSKSIANIEDSNLRRRILSIISNIERFKKIAASSEETPPEALMKLAGDDVANIRWYVSKNTSTPPEALMKLAGYENLKKDVAKNTSAPREVLMMLAGDADMKVREYVASNINTPLEALMKLAGDDDMEVRKSVAYNKNTPVEVLIKLAEDSKSEIRSIIAWKKIPPEVLAKLAEDDNRVRFHVAANENTPPEALMKLADAHEADIRWRVASNYATLPETLIKLAGDEIDRVREEVANNKNTPLDVLMKLAKNDVSRNVRRYANNNFVSLSRGLQESLLRRVIRQLL